MRGEKVNKILVTEQSGPQKKKKKNAIRQKADKNSFKISNFYLPDSFPLSIQTATGGLIGSMMEEASSIYEVGWSNP